MSIRSLEEISCSDHVLKDISNARRYLQIVILNTDKAVLKAEARAARHFGP